MEQWYNWQKVHVDFLQTRPLHSHMTTGHLRNIMFIYLTASQFWDYIITTESLTLSAHTEGSVQIIRNSVPGIGNEFGEAGIHFLLGLIVSVRLLRNKPGAVHTLTDNTKLLLLITVGYICLTKMIAFLLKTLCREITSFIKGQKIIYSLSVTYSIRNKTQYRKTIKLWCYYVEMYSFTVKAQIFYSSYATAI